MHSDQMQSFQPFLGALEARGGDVAAFLHDIFQFLACSTDFYHISQNNSEETGYPAGFVEKLVIETFRSCDPNCQYQNGNIFLPAAVAEEVEISTFEELDVDSFTVDVETENAHETEPDLENHEDTHHEISDPSENISFQSLNINDNTSQRNKDSNTSCSSSSMEESKNKNEQTPPKETTFSESDIVSTPLQDSESYNGAICDTYKWSQNICELDVNVMLPEKMSSKNLNVKITGDSICVQYRSKDLQWISLVDDKLSQKIKPTETLWTISEGCVRIHLEKQIERWWDSLIVSEPKLDTSTLNCSRPLHELSDEHLAKVREVQWNHMQKLAGLPTSDEIQRDTVLRKAWDLPGSPFANTPYDPSILNP